MAENRFPPGWDEARVRAIIEHYENQTEDEAVAEDEAAFDNSDSVMVQVPKDLLPEVLGLIAKHRRD